MPTCAEVLARTLKDAGVTRMFGLPGGEMLDFLEAARRAGIRFVLTRHEATAAFMADVTGQIQRRPGVCVATARGRALRRSLPQSTKPPSNSDHAGPPFTKQAITLDGDGTEGKVREALRLTRAPRMGPVHIALPSDVARARSP